MKKILFILVWGICLWALPLSATDQEPVKVFVSILPQQFFVKQIGKELVWVNILVGPNMSPHSYEPLPHQMSDLSLAQVFFGVGVGFEKSLLPKLAAMFPKLKIVNTDKNIKKRSLEAFEEDEHCADSHDCHFHKKGEVDPHIWLDPVLIAEQGKIIAQTLIDLLPADKEEIEANLAEFTSACAALEKELANLLLPLKGQTMLVFHPAFGYFADRFGLVQRSVEIGGKEPGPRQLAALIRRCKAEGVRVVFVQKQFPVASARAIATAIQGAVVAIDPLAKDCFANLRHIAAAVHAAGIK